MLLYIVRHGTTSWNLLRRIQGIADIPLTEEGLRMAEETGRALQDVSFDKCICSPLLRARQTAEKILAGKNVPLILDPRIQEINFGVLEGKVLRDQEGNILEPRFISFFDDPLRFERPEDGENIPDVLERTRDFWQELVSDTENRDRTILVCSHGCAVRGILQNVYQDPEHFWHGSVPPNCSVNLVEVDEKGTRLLWEDRTFWESPAAGPVPAGKRIP